VTGNQHSGVVGPEVVVNLEFVVTVRLDSSIPSKNLAQEPDADRGLTGVEPLLGQVLKLGQDVRIVGVESTESGLNRRHV
jgi:hypothetical protein